MTSDRTSLAAAPPSRIVRLSDLEPRWWGYNGRKHGLSFLCPHCRKVRLGIAVVNPPDGGPPHDLRFKHDEPGSLTQHVHDLRSFDVPPGFLWTLAGTDFATISLTPSVDASKSGHWHGHVSNGEIR